MLISVFFEENSVSLRWIRTNLGEILPASLPKLPIQLRDLRNNQKSFNNYFISFHGNVKNLVWGIWISVSRHLEPVLGRKIIVASEFQDQIHYF